MNTKTDKEMLYKISKLEEELATLKAELQKPKLWKPEEGEGVHFVSGNGHVISTVYCDKADRELVKVGNCFKTLERAKQVATKYRMLLKLEQLHDMFCPDYEPDWKNRDETKYFVLYDSRTKIWDVQDTEEYKEAVNVWFDSLETAEKVCELLNKEECNSECK